MLLEVISISLIVPLLSAIVNQENFTNISIINSFILDKISKFNQENLILFFLGCFLTIFIMKILFNIFVIYSQNKFSVEGYQLLSNNLLKKYISQNWNFFTKVNTGNLIRNVINETGHLQRNIIYASIKILSDLIVLTGILILLVLVEPQITIITFVFIFFLSVLYKFFTKKYVYKLGSNRQKKSGELNKLLIEVFGLIKDIKFLNKEKFFLNKFSFLMRDYLNSIKYSYIVSQLPRQIIEILILISISFLTYYLLIINETKSDAIVVIGFFLVAAYRIAPSINSIISHLNLFDFSKSSLELMLREIDDIKFEKKLELNNFRPLKFNSEISYENISYFYEKDKLILDDISFKIKKNQIIGIRGSSGSGKTTLINLVAGLIKPKKGKILIDKSEVNYANSNYQYSVGIVHQDIFLIDDSIKNNIAIGEENINLDRLNSAIKKSDLEYFINNLAHGIETKTGEKGVKISGGQKQRIGIARMLYFDADLLILDEATNSLDTETEKNILKTIQNFRKNKSIIIISHNDEIFSYCDRVYKVQNKKITETK